MAKLVANQHQLRILRATSVEMATRNTFLDVGMKKSARSGGKTTGPRGPLLEVVVKHLSFAALLQVEMSKKMHDVLVPLRFV